jgi:FtsZ-binding cell division protein ZapB
VDFLTKKTKANHGEIPQYYVENDHEAIISPQVFDLAQEEIKRRGRGGKRHSGVSIFSSKIKCGDCGSWYGAKVWHSNDKYRRTIYRCNDKFKHHCKTPHLTEEDIKAIFVKAVNKLVGNKDEIISNIQLIREQLCDTANLESEQDRLNQDLIALTDMTENCIAENARVSQDQTEYQKRYDSLVSRYDKTKEQYEAVTAKIKDSQSRNEQLGVFIDNLQGQNLIGEFDKHLWCSLVDYITAYSKNDIRVTFKDGTELRV